MIDYNINFFYKGSDVLEDELLTYMIKHDRYMNRFLTCSQSQGNNNNTRPLIPQSKQAGFSVPENHPFDVNWEEGTWLTYMGESLQAPLSHAVREV